MYPRGFLSSQGAKGSDETVWFLVWDCLSAGLRKTVNPTYEQTIGRVFVLCIVTGMAKAPSDEGAVSKAD